MRNPYTVVPTGNEVVDRNLRALADALRSLTAAAAAAAVDTDALTHVGQLTANGSLALPAGTLRAVIECTGTKNGGGQVDMTINGLVAGYQWCNDGTGFAADTKLPIFAAGIGGATDFRAFGTVGLAAATALARWNQLEQASFGAIDASGYVAAAALTTLGFAFTLVNSPKVDVWALTAG